MNLLLLFLGTMFGLGLCLQRGIVSDNLAANSALAGGLGAGLGIAWKFLAGQDRAGFLVESAFLVGGILLMNGALIYGKRIRRLRAKAARSEETVK